MCQMHQRLLLEQAGIGPEGPWRAAIVSAQVTMFQGCSALPETHTRIGGDITRISELGCLACYSPEVFGKVVEALCSGGFAAVKALGEKLVLEGSATNGLH
jgi:hypothetical protein